MEPGLDDLAELEISNPFPEGSQRALEYEEELRENLMTHARARRVRTAVRAERQRQIGY